MGNLIYLYCKLFTQRHVAGHTWHVAPRDQWPTPSSFPSSGASFGVCPVRRSGAIDESPWTNWLTDWLTNRPAGRPAHLDLLTLHGQTSGNLHSIVMKKNGRSPFWWMEISTGPGRVSKTKCCRPVCRSVGMSVQGLSSIAPDRRAEVSKDAPEIGTTMVLVTWRQVSCVTRHTWKVRKKF